MSYFKKSIFLIIPLTFLLANSSLAANNRDGIWFGTFANKTLTENYSYWIETQVRYGSDTGETRQILYRTGVLQKLNEVHGLGYLYGYIQTGITREHRLALQHSQKYGNWCMFSFSHRARLEARFLEDNHKDAGRFRYLLRADQTGFNTYGLVIWDEVFINTNSTDWNGNQSFDRNRFFIGMKRMFLESNKLEFGYLNQYTPLDSGDTSEHIINIGLSF